MNQRILSEKRLLSTKEADDFSSQPSGAAGSRIICGGYRAIKKPFIINTLFSLTIVSAGSK